MLIVLSGPEPQRTLLENILLEQLRDFHEPALFIRGLPVESPSGDSTETIINPFNQITFYNHLPSTALNEAMNASEIIISRSGYSTVMDAMQLEKQCIFIPTPGQAEQQYLAKYLSARKHCVFFQQEKFCLKQALETATGINVIN